MNPPTERSVADIADRHSRLLAAAVGLFALKYTVSASMHLVEGQTLRVLDTLEIVLALGGLLLMLPVMIWKRTKLSADDRHLYFGEDSYVVAAFRKARTVSWAVVFIMLVVLEIASKRFDQLPARFYLQVTIALLLGSFTVAFLYLCRSTDDEEDGVEHA